MKFLFWIFFLGLIPVGVNAQGTHVESVLPYRLVGGKMIVEMKMNGQLRSFIFDTGGQTALTEEVCDELGLPACDSIKITDVNGKQGGYRRVLIQELADPEMKIQLKTIPTIVIPAPSPFACFQVDGLIGSDLLQYFIVEIDGKAQTIKLIASQQYAAPSLRKMLPFAGGGGMPIINIQIGRGNGVPVLFDTGCPGFLNLKESDYERLENAGAFQSVQTGYGEGAIGVGGMAGVDTSYRVCMPVVSIGASRFLNVSSETSTPPYTLLGVKLLDYGKVTIDYARSRFYFEPYEEKAQDMEQRHYDINLRVKDGDLVVSSLWSDKYAGVRIGDKVIKINGEPVRKYDFCESILNGIPELKKKKSNKLTILTKNGEKTIVYKKE